MEVPKELTPEFLKDVILKCYKEENRKSLVEMHIYNELSKEDFEKELIKNTTANLREKFEILSGDFDKPTKTLLLRLLELLADEGKQYGRSEETIKKNFGKMEEFVLELPED